MGLGVHFSVPAQPPDAVRLGGSGRRGPGELPLQGETLSERGGRCLWTPSCGEGRTPWRAVLLSHLVVLEMQTHSLLHSPFSGEEVGGCWGSPNSDAPVPSLASLTHHLALLHASPHRVALSQAGSGSPPGSPLQFSWPEEIPLRGNIPPCTRPPPPCSEAFSSQSGSLCPFLPLVCISSDYMCHVLFLWNGCV